MLAVALFGSAVAVLPGLATAANPPSVTASNYMYTPMQVAVMPNGSVYFANGGGTHDVHFNGSLLPSSCTGSPAQIGPSAGDPSAMQTASNSSWTGTCTFTQEGTYTFVCTNHGFTGTIYVNSAGTVPTTTGTTTTTTTTTIPTSPPPTTTGTTPTGTTPSGGGGQTAARSLRSPAVQHGTAVKGSVTIASGGADFEADLLGNPSQVARSVLVGKTVKHGVGAGKLNFKVSLNKRGRSALKRHRRLGLKLIVEVGAPGAAGTSLSRSISLRS
jgi:plastocyanin